MGIGGRRGARLERVRRVPGAGEGRRRMHELTGQVASWNSSISVDDVDLTTSRARDLGALVLREPFDVLGEGRESVLRDPVGAVVSLWQARSHIGAGLVNEVSTWGWNELSATDFDREPD